MKPVFQTKFGGPDAPAEEQGDCLRAALASALELDLEDVPDLTGKWEKSEGGDGTWWTAIHDWLRPMGLALYPVNVGSGPPTGIHIAAVESTMHPGEGHVVVAEHGNFVHDPNRRAPGIGKVEQWWAFVPIDSARVRRAMEDRADG